MMAMTLPTAILILSVPVAFFAALMIWRAYADSELDRLACYDEWTTQFYSSAKRLMERDDLPEEWLENIDDINTFINEPRAAYVIYQAFSKRRSQSDKK